MVLDECQWIVITVIKYCGDVSFNCAHKEIQPGVKMLSVCVFLEIREVKTSL